MKLFNYKIKDNKFYILLLNQNSEIDYTNLDEFTKILKTGIEKGFKEIFLDFTNLTFIDSSGLGRLIAAVKDTRITIINCNTNIEKIFKMTNLMSFFNFK